MPRKLLLKTVELGDLDLYLIYQYDLDWEEDWKPLQDQSITSLLTVIDQETWDHALKGWTSPLIKTLGLPPSGALRKVESKCYRRKLCPFHSKKTCFPTATKMPWCFEPDSIEDPAARQLASNLVRLWREQVHILVITHKS